MKHYCWEIVIALLISITVQAQQCDSLYIASLKLYDSENYNASLEAINTVIQKCGNTVDYQLHKAKCFSELKDTKGKLGALNAALALDSNCIAALSEKAAMYMSADIYSSAIKCYKKILSLIPATDTTTRLYLTNLGALYVYTNQNNKAFDLLWDYCQKDSSASNEYMLTNLSASAIYIGKYAEAEWALSKILTDNPANVKALVNMGLCKEGQKDYDAAIAYYDKAMLYVPDDAYAWNNRGYAYYMQGNYKNALDNIEKSITLDPSNSYAYRNKALVFIAMGKKKDACKNLEQAIEAGFTEMYGNEVLQLIEQNCR
ncbi:MAG: tetratricopeptide repeat protein [Bacteroidales bacterium]|nr:tetratricopeptide repeat protein [Bacteroidales bacterium]